MIRRQTNSRPVTSPTGQLSGTIVFFITYVYSEYETLSFVTFTRQSSLIDWLTANWYVRESYPQRRRHAGSMAKCGYSFLRQFHFSEVREGRELAVEPRATFSWWPRSGVQQCAYAARYDRRCM